MNIQEKLDFFQQLIQCNHNLPLHSFSPDFVFAHSDILEDVSANDDKTLILLSLEEPIRKHVENQKQEPLFIDDHLGKQPRLFLLLPRRMSTCEPHLLLRARSLEKPPKAWCLSRNRRRTVGR